MNIQFRYLITIFIFIFFSGTSLLAQLNIVGVNTDKPTSKIDYLDNPIQIEKLFVRESGYSNSMHSSAGFVMPQGQLVYHAENCFPYIGDNWQGYPGALRIQGDSLIVGWPAGYYNIVGALITREELSALKSLYDRGSANSKVFLYDDNLTLKNAHEFASNHPKFNKYTYFHDRDFFSGGSYEFYFPSSAELKNNIASTKYPRNILRAIVYVLQDQQGNHYYVRGLGGCIKVDYVNTLVRLYKGKPFYLLKYDKENSDISRSYIEDYYTHFQVPVDVNACGFYGNVDNHAKINAMITDLETKPSFYCEDIIIDGKDILAILDINGNKVTAKLQYSFEEKPIILFDDNYNTVLEYCFRRMPLEKNVSIISSEDCNELKNNSERALSILKMAREEREAQYAREEEQRKGEIIKKYGAHYGNKIIEHKLAIGMTQEMCIESIGYPSNVAKSVNAYGESSVWFYSNYMSLVFVDKKLQQVNSGF